MRGDPTLDALERSLSAVLRSLGDRVTSESLAAACGYDLPQASWALLEYLEALGPLRVSQIAACHGVDVSSVTPRLQKLERSGLIARTRDTGDARVFHISLAPSGTQALDAVHAARRDLLAGALTGADSAEVGTASAVMDRIARHLDVAVPARAGRAQERAEH